MVSRIDVSRPIVSGIVVVSGIIIIVSEYGIG